MSSGIVILLVVFLVVQAANAAPQYSDPLARNFMLPLSAAAYSDQPQQCLSRLFKNATPPRLAKFTAFIVQVTCVTVIALAKKAPPATGGITAVLHNEKAIVLSFSFIHSFVAREQCEKFQASWLFGGRISAYFSDAFSKIWSHGMDADFRALRAMYPNTENFWVTGHSLGGSVASLAASFLVGSRLANSSEVKLVTFGQPRTGDISFRSSQQSGTLEYSFRVTHWRDIVPHIPLDQLADTFITNRR
ncbi:triacylglycerol lipase [Cooperia oncophora]